MAEYIEREAAIDEIEGTTWYHISCQKNLVEGAACEADALYKATDIYNVIKSAPTADVAEVKHGAWDENHRCTVCQKPALCQEKPDPYMHGLLALFYVDSDYCPQCGAKMDGKEVEGE